MEAFENNRDRAEKVEQARAGAEILRRLEAELGERQSPRRASDPPLRNGRARIVT